ncbi:hypothetical protein RJ640_024610 [Escallonia rubra]|uniref:APO domain-containing protein n=1 Tax=Escallonia rubra TaxID=112253 RepID=A0AA88RUU3_9ASTE|nr:hypothetical protein RJ640_024610 [Escallonia rubra]
MASKNHKLWPRMMMLSGLLGRSQLYSSKPELDMKKLRPMILRRKQARAKDYPVKPMVQVAFDVLKARTFLIRGVSTLLQILPIWACRYCPELHIGEKGHLIRTCGGYRHGAKIQVHEWIKGSLNDILVPVETFHIRNMFQSVIRHNQRSDFDRVSAVIELCLQAGADTFDESLCPNNENLDGVGNSVVGTEQLSSDDVMVIASGTLRAWETLRSGVQKLLSVYPSKVCKYCSEVHVGPSGHKAWLRGVFKYESWCGDHFWKKADVDDLVPPKVVWFRRPHDPPVLLDKGREFYGHAPAVVDLCTKAGVIAPSKSMLSLPSMLPEAPGPSHFTPLRQSLHYYNSKSPTSFLTSTSTTPLLFVAIFPLHRAPSPFPNQPPLPNRSFASVTPLFPPPC